MARPRSDAGPTAVYRMEEAFFNQLKVTPYQRITISSIVKEAGVNRNSFYYHYEDLDGLARTSVGRLLVSEIPRLVAAGLTPDSEEFSSILARAIEDGNYEKMLALTGPHSTAELRGMLKEAVIQLWLSTFGLDREDLSLEETLTVNFVMSGALEVASGAAALANPSRTELAEALTVTRALPVVRVNAEILAKSLDAAAQRKTLRAGRETPG